MKKLLTTIGLAALLVGCTTTQTGQKTVDPQLLAVVAQEAASMGTVYWLQSHPADRAQFELARTSLRILVNTGSGSIADLQKAIASLPIKQFQGSQGQVIVTGAVVLLDAAGKQLITLDKQQVWSTYVLPVASGLLAGLDQALGTQAKISNKQEYKFGDIPIGDPRNQFSGGIVNTLVIDKTTPGLRMRPDGELYIDETEVQKVKISELENRIAQLESRRYFGGTLDPMPSVGYQTLEINPGTTTLANLPAYWVPQTGTITAQTLEFRTVPNFPYATAEAIPDNK